MKWELHLETSKGETLYTIINRSFVACVMRRTCKSGLSGSLFCNIFTILVVAYRIEFYVKNLHSSITPGLACGNEPDM
jgi:hypothetical protein